MASIVVTIVICGICVVAAVGFLLSFQPVRPGFRGVSIWLGKRVSVLTPSGEEQRYKVVSEGWHFVLPILSRIIPIDCREQYVEVPKESVYTSDGIHVEPKVEVYYKVDEPAKILGLHEELLTADNEVGLIKVVQATYRASIATRDLKSCRDANGKKLLELDILASLGGLEEEGGLSEYRTVTEVSEDSESRLRSRIADGRRWVSRWGIKVTGVKVSDIEPTEDDKDVIELMARKQKEILAGDAKIAKQEREKTATIIDADAALYKAKKEAEGTEAKLMAPVNAKVAEATRMSAALPDGGYQQLLRTKALEAIGTSPSTKVIVPPTGLSQVVGEGTTVFDAVRAAAVDAAGTRRPTASSSGDSGADSGSST